MLPSHTLAKFDTFWDSILKIINNWPFYGQAKNPQILKKKKLEATIAYTSVNNHQPSDINQ
jgi:hypothetical protein